MTKKTLWKIILELTSSHVISAGVLLEQIYDHLGWNDQTISIHSQRSSWIVQLREHEYRWNFLELNFLFHSKYQKSVYNCLQRMETSKSSFFSKLLWLDWNVLNTKWQKKTFIQTQLSKDDNTQLKEN